MNRILSYAFFTLSMMLTAVLIDAQDQVTPTAAQRIDVVFAIGKEDGSDAEFQSWGWTGKDEFTCRAGVDCTDNKFPAYLHLRGVDESYGVIRLNVIFVLKQSYDNMVLRLARGGDETTLVTVDGKRSYAVTSAMLGSGEGFHVGSYELGIGKLGEGEHSIEFTVIDDGRGDKSYAWDALELFTLVKGN